MCNLPVNNVIIDCCGNALMTSAIITRRYCLLLEEEFEDTQGVIRIRKSKKNRHHNVQKKTDKKTNNDLQKIHIKPKIE